MLVWRVRPPTATECSIQLLNAVLLLLLGAPLLLLCLDLGSQIRPGIHLLSTAALLFLHLLFQGCLRRCLWIYWLVGFLSGLLFLLLLGCFLLCFLLLFLLLIFRVGISFGSRLCLRSPSILGLVIGFFFLVDAHVSKQRIELSILFCLLLFLRLLLLLRFIYSNIK